MSVKVYDLNGKLIEINEYDNVKKYIDKKQARWVSYNVLELCVDRNCLNNRSDISKSMRRRIIEEERGVCYICGRKIPKSQFPTIDHIVSVNQGGSNSRNNLRCCCYECNRDKGSMDLTQYYNHVRSNRNEYKKINDKQLKNIEKTMLKIQTQFPVVKSEIKNDQLTIYINNVRSFTMRKNDTLEQMLVEVLNLLKDINKDYIIQF